MSIPNNQNPFDLQGLLGRQIAEAAGKELLSGLMGGGAKRGLDAGLNMAKDIKLGDIISTVEKVVGDVNAAREEATASARENASVARETARKVAEEARSRRAAADGAVFIPFAKSEEDEKTASVKVQTEKPAPQAPEAQAPVAEPVKESTIPSVEANDNIDRIHDIATSKLNAEEHELLVTAVMNLVQIASPNGFTGEHVRWLSRLYGNKSI